MCQLWSSSLQFVNRPNRIEMTQITKEQILRCLLERSSLRSICRIFDISLGRLVRFIQKHMEKVPNDLKLNITEEMKSEDADYEVDELCSFVQKKKSKVWIWVVLHRETRQIVAFHMGGRGIKDCKKLWKKLEDLGIKGKLHTDLWKAYAAVFPKHMHHPHEHRGPTNHIERFNGTLRARVSRLVRRSYSFAKSYRNLYLSLRFFCTNYNLSLL